MSPGLPAHTLNGCGKRLWLILPRLLNRQDCQRHSSQSALCSPADGQTAGKIQDVRLTRYRFARRVLKNASEFEWSSDLLEAIKFKTVS